MDENLVAFTSLRITEDQVQAEHHALNWVDGRTDKVDRPGPVTQEVSRGLLEVADTLCRNDNPVVASLGEQIVKLLASLYADHPDYRTEWRPRTTE